MNNQFLSASYARILFRHLRLNETNGDAFFAGTGINYSELMALDVPFTFDDQKQLFQNALNITDEEALGLSVGSQLHLSSHGHLGVAAFSSQNLGEALNTFVRFSDVREQIIEINASNESDGFHIQLTEPVDLGELRFFLIESIISAIYSAVRFFTGQSAIDGSIHFTYPAPTYKKRYEAAFLMPVHFSAQVTEIIIPHEALLIPSPVADEHLHQEAVEHCANLLRTMHQHTFKDKVRSLLLNNPGKLWTLEEVASQLHLSPRTLIRKLANEKTKFQEVRDDLIKQQAKSYLSNAKLNNKTMTVESIALLLGFSDVSSFRRSFKRWFGMSPAEYLASLD